MAGWNEIIANRLQGPIINYYQAFLLWAIVIIFVYLTFKNSISIKIHTSNEEMKDEEIDELIHDMDKAKENTSEDKF